MLTPDINLPPQCLSREQTAVLEAVCNILNHVQRFLLKIGIKSMSFGILKCPGRMVIFLLPSYSTALKPINCYYFSRQWSWQFQDHKYHGKIRGGSLYPSIVNIFLSHTLSDTGRLFSGKPERAFSYHDPKRRLWRCLVCVQQSNNANP